MKENGVAYVAKRLNEMIKGRTIDQFWREPKRGYHIKIANQILDRFDLLGQTDLGCLGQILDGGSQAK